MDSPHQIEFEAEASGSARINQVAGDQVIYEGLPPYQFESVMVPAPVHENDRLLLQPSKMLRTYYEVVPFWGRQSEICRLQKWRDSPAGTGVQLIHGPGGQGKTRLALHLAHTWADDGWIAYQAFAHGDFYRIDADATPPSVEGAGKLIIADYAERWEISDLLSLLRHAAEPAKLPIRVILISRPAGTWWQTIAHRLDKDFDIDADALHLSALGEDPKDRIKIFEDAVDRFAYLLDVSGAQDIQVPLLIEDDDSYGLVLTAHMAALAAVLAAGRGDIPPEDPAELSAFLLVREWDHWRVLHGRQQDPMQTSPDAMRQTVYTATLTGPLSYEDGLSALARAQIESYEHPGQLIRDHKTCYLSQEPDSVLEPLYPDRLGEDFIALTTPGHQNSIYTPDPWAIGALKRLLDPIEETNQIPQPWAQSAMNLLTEIGGRWPHIASLTWAGSFSTGRHHRRL